MIRSKPFSAVTGPKLADILEPSRNSFGVIRLAMAIAVLFSHSYWFTTGSKIADPMVRWTGHSIGEHAVQVFFFLSGILVAQSLIRSRSVLNYAVARALRIFPALILCVLLTALVLGPMFSTASLGDYFRDGDLPRYVVKTILLVTGSAPLPHLFHDQPLPHMVNVSLWTLKYEVLCYVSLGIVGYFGLLNDRLRPLTTALIALVVIGVFTGRPKPLDTYTFVDNLRYFILYFYGGVLAFLLRDHLRINGLVLIPLAGLFAGLVGTRFGELACCLLLGYATLWFATMKFGGLRAFTTDNDYSYGVYIFAGPIQQLVISLLPDYGPTAVSLHALSIALPLAVFSWELVERPAIAMRKPILAWLARLGVPAARPTTAVETVSPAPIDASRIRLATGVARRPTLQRNGSVVKLPRRPAKIVGRPRRPALVE